MARRAFLRAACLGGACPQPALWLTLLLPLSAACNASPPQDRLLGAGWQSPEADASQPGDDAIPGPNKRHSHSGCAPTQSAEPLPAREATMSAQASTRVQGVTASDLFGKFVDHCGRCHTNGRNQGGFDVSLPTFAELVSAESVARMRSDDPALGMPQPFVAFSKRSANDPIVAFAAELDAWIRAGNPEVSFPASGGAAAASGAASSYLLTRQVGMDMTNLGNCIPGEGMFEAPSDAARELDAKFRALESFADLPKKLSETDMVSLDSEELARHGVVAFAPTYPLWSDDAKKLRYVRVPLGESIRFDEDAQSFDIPANTRFYKTFMKEVTDFEGNKRLRKIETRLILSRPERELAGGSEPGALFATYKWNESETEATLVDEPYASDQTGFHDDVFTYVVDERREDELLSQAKSESELLSSGARRTYAIPGSDRCTHCHMGQPSFVLGFLPMQIHRRPKGEGGVIEDTGPDELTQFDRLLQYGVISGATSSAQVRLLEDSQGERKPRNEHELRAQGYMLGNCAHCHNPNGFPSRREPILADLLNFLPDTKSGGIFQFPLDRFSPRSFRGRNNDIPIPYITPSLFDHADSVNFGSSGRKWITVRDGDAGGKRLEILNDLIDAALKALIPATLDVNETRAATDTAEASYGLGGAATNVARAYGAGRPLLAPWRSLIYRNVDSPASYEDAGAIYPHMPMDTSGYDCRVRQLLGSWMASIPAQRVLASGEPDSVSLPAPFADYPELVSLMPQPYAEVQPGDRRYRNAAKEAEARLARFQASERYRDCPSRNLDIVAPEVLNGSAIVPTAQRTVLQPELGDASDFYELRSPARPHYAKTDLHDDPIWIQRRPDWFEILVVEAADAARKAAGGDVAKNSEQAIAAVNGRKLGPDFKQFALEPVPFGLWSTKPECEEKLAAQPKVADVPHMEWMDVVAPDPSGPVYMISRGEQIFNTICSKCHGPHADGQSALSNTIADLTGGKTRVANLRDGLFGPLGDPGQNRAEIFAIAAGRADKTCATEPNAPRCTGLSAEDWVARYVAWMGLGGTNAAIPGPVLAKIGKEPILGALRLSNFASVSDRSEAANMLSVAKKACVLFTEEIWFDPRKGRPIGPVPDVVDKNRTEAREYLEGLGLIPRNGDLELWRSVCEFQNPSFVQVLRLRQDNSGKQGLKLQKGEKSLKPLFPRELYPPTARVGVHDGATVAGISSDNLGPWCVDAQESALRAYETTTGIALPACPPVFYKDGMLDGVKVVGIGTDERFNSLSPETLQNDAINTWAARGATNAGIAVYYWLDALARGEVKPTPSYDRCEDL